MITKKRLGSILIIVLCAFILTGIGITVFMMLNRENKGHVIKVRLDDAQTGTAEFDNIGLIPGTTVEYKVYLSGLKQGSYTIGIRFQSLGESRLGQYIDADVFYDGQTVCHAKLSELFDGDSYSFACDVKNKSPLELTVRYTMPEDIHNEAQNAESSFDLIIGAEST